MDNIENSQEPNYCVIIPTYNNVRTVGAVIDSVRNYCSNIIVVNDGSTDATSELLHGYSDICLISYAANRGKGHALKVGLRKAIELNYDYAITIDADGQHFADDIPVFLDGIKRSPNALLVGARNLAADGMPSKNTFANKFSNFWFKVETGITMADTQSGYRLYPLKYIDNMKFITPRYEFEVEVLVRCAWRGVDVKNVPVKVIYPEDRVSHFRPLHDFTRISILNTFLVLIALIYYYPISLIKGFFNGGVKRFIANHITYSGQSNLQLACAIGFGVFMGIVPIWGYQMLVAVALAHLLRLNKALVLVFANISIPPMIPFIVYASIWMGCFVMSKPMIDISFDIKTLGQGAIDYVCGAIVFAVAAGIATFCASFALLSLFRHYKK